MHTCKKEPLRVWWMCTVFTLWPCFVATFANSSVISSASTCGLRYQMGRGEQLWVEMFTPEVWRYTRHQPQLRNIEDGFPKIRPSYISDTPVTCKFLIHHIQSAPPNSTVVLQACESHFVLQVLKARGAQQAQVPADQILGKLCLDRPSTHKILQYWLVVSFSLFSIMYGIILPID